MAKIDRDHVRAAVSCCLETALWSTLWMAGQVSLMASGGLSASRMRLLMNFSVVWTRSACGQSMKGTRLMCGYLSILVLSALLAMCPGRVLAAATRDGLQEKRGNNGYIQICGRTIEVEDEIHTRMLPLSVHNASEIKHLLFNEYLGATV